MALLQIKIKTVSGRRGVMRPVRIIALAAAAWLCMIGAGCGGGEKAGFGNVALSEKYAALAEAVRNDGLQGEKAFAMLSELVRTAGPRLSGTRAAAEAVAHMLGLMNDLGLETWLEPTSVQHWIRGEERAFIPAGPGERKTELAITALGGSEPTPPGGIAAGVVEISSFEELELRQDEVKGAIVFFNHPMDRRIIDPFRAYGEAAVFRSEGPSRAARFGAAAALVRSLTFRIDGHPHTGMVGYDPALAKIPAAAVSTSDAEVLSARLKANPRLKVFLRLGCRNLEPVPTANVIGQIRGTEKPEEIILLGAHLDAWDLAVGAHDDGAGCVQAVEALRLITRSGLKPLRTIRAVLFMNEEFGASGGRDYAADPRRKNERTIAAMESDRGGFLPLYAVVGGPPAIQRKWKAYETLFRDLGLAGIQSGGGGSDIGPVVASGAVPMGFVPASQSYFDVHHSDLDTLDKVHPRELEMGAIVFVLLAVIASEEGI